MLLRPYTISAVANILFNLLVAAYLLFGAEKSQPQTRKLNQTLASILLMVSVIILHQNLLTLGNNPRFDLTQYVRNIEAIILFYLSIHFVYLALAQTTDTFAVEARRVKWAFFVVIAIEIGYTTWRYVSSIEAGGVSARPLYLQLPMLLPQLWLMILVGRGIIFVERQEALQTDRKITAWSAFRHPQTALARMLVQISLAVSLTFLVSALFIAAPLRTAPWWLSGLSDPIVLLSTLAVSSAYMRYQLTYVGLELRVISAGLAIFLIMTSALGWLVTTAFFRIELPDVPLRLLVGSILDNNFILSADYLPVARRLHRLLLPIFWFELFGSILFVGGLHLFFRVQIEQPISALLTGIDRLEQGQLSYRLPDAFPDELGRISMAFNDMAQSLMVSNDNLTHYQTHLEELVDTRTAELRSESEQRQAVELRVAIQEERNRIARETHDSVLQRLFAIRVRLRSRRLRNALSKTLPRELDDLAQDVLDCSQELRHIINQMAVDWEALSLPMALRTLIERFEKAYSISATLTLNTQIKRLPSHQQVTVVRVVEEALSNVGKHSGASAVEVTLSESLAPSCLNVCVCDNGIGIAARADASSGAGHGLANMRDRATAVRGELSIRPNGSVDDADSMPGTCIELRLPLASVEPQLS